MSEENVFSILGFDIFHKERNSSVSTTVKSDSSSLFVLNSQIFDKTG